MAAFSKSSSKALVINMWVPSRCNLIFLIFFMLFKRVIAFSYFLGSSSPYKNYDRDALVYCENPDENSSVNDILSYFGKVWNYKESKAFINGVNALTDTDTYFTISEKNEYNYCVENTYSHNNSVDSSRITDKKNKLAAKKKVDIRSN